MATTNYRTAKRIETSKVGFVATELHFVVDAKGERVSHEWCNEIGATLAKYAASEFNAGRFADPYYRYAA